MNDEVPARENSFSITVLHPRCASNTHLPLPVNFSFKYFIETRGGGFCKWGREILSVMLEATNGVFYG